MPDQATLDYEQPDINSNEYAAGEDINTILMDYVKHKNSPDFDTEKIRNSLIEQYLPLVGCIARKVHSGKSPNVQLDDLFSSGTLGLKDALNSFNSEKEVKFSTYANKRIWGAMMDDLRKRDPIPRLVRTRKKRLEGAINVLRSEHKYLDDEMVGGELVKRLEESNWSPTNPGEFGRDPRQARENEAKKITEDSRLAVDTVGLYSKEVGAESSRIDYLEDKKSPVPSAQMDARATKDFLMKGLTSDERFILDQHDFCGTTMKLIGVYLGKSESRVSQMHSEILKTVKSRLEVHGISEENYREHFKL